MQKGFDELIHNVMRHYHDEQIWSDRVRSLSTYVSIGLGAMNVLLFLLALLLIEPYKRRRLAKTLETRLVQGEEEARARMEKIISSIDERLGQLTPDAVVSEATPTPAAAVHRLEWPLWLQGLWQHWQSWQRVIMDVWQQHNPIPKDQASTVASTATGVVLGGVVTYALALLCL